MPPVFRGHNAPCADQTGAAIEAWMRANVRVGVEVVIRYAVGRRLRYERARVVRIDSARFEVAVRRRDGTYDRLGGGFYYSGKNSWHPAGLSHLVIPTPAVLAACAACEENGGSLAGVRSGLVAP
jgi:hypothetical protein